MKCPHCTYDVTPDNRFPVADGSEYHILCYQKACLAAGMPDPFPKCDHCGEIVWQYVDGKLNLAVRGSVCAGTDENGEPAWRAGRFHPECVPEEPDRLSPDEPGREVWYFGEMPDIEHAVIAQGQQDIDAESGRPICPSCGRTIQRSPTPFDGILYHKNCAAAAISAAHPQRARSQTMSRRPKCPVCTRGVAPDPEDWPEERARDIVCTTEEGDEVHYHRACYRKAMIAAGQPDPYPPPDKATVRARFSAGKEKAAARRKEATLVCGICNEKVLRAAYPDHIIPCAEKARSVALATEG